MIANLCCVAWVAAMYTLGATSDMKVDFNFMNWPPSVILGVVLFSAFPIAAFKIISYKER